MANINEFINTAKDLADLAGKKAGEAVEVSKLKINNVKINGEIQKTYEKLGAFVYKFQKRLYYIVYYYRKVGLFMSETEKLKEFLFDTKKCGWDSVSDDSKQEIIKFSDDCYYDGWMCK